MATTNCIVVKIDLIIHKPKVIDADETEIPEEDEMTKGSATFVNLDNDDKDQFFDSNPNGTPDAYVTDGDNELVKLTMRLQPKSMFSSGSVKLEITAGAEYVKMYKADTKAFSKIYNSGDYIPVDDFIVDGDSLKKDIWVEGKAPHSEPRQTALKMTYDGMPDLTDEVALTVIGVEEVEWKAIGVQIINNDPNWPEGLSPQGWRVFPDKYLPAEEAASHEKVNVSVKLSVEPPFPIKFYLRAFDIDDPSFNEGVVDDEQNARDNVYPELYPDPEKSLDNGKSMGTFEGILLFSHDENITELNLLPETKTNSAVFYLSPCPGDNFRIVANGDNSFLEQLENNDTLLNIGSTIAEKLQNLQRIVDPLATGVPAGSPSVQEVRVSEKYCSRTLTTWRKLWIERDSMGPIPEEKRWVQGIVSRYSVSNKADTNGSTYSSFSGSMYAPYEGRPPSKDEFEGGKLYFKIWTNKKEYYLMGAENGGPFHITRSKKLFESSFEIWPALSASQLAVIQEIHRTAGTVFYKAQDDADYTIFDQPQFINTDPLMKAYYKAYIDPVYADTFNKTKIQPYIREVSAYHLMGSFYKSRDFGTSTWMWTTHVVASFEGAHSLLDDDLDPDNYISDTINQGVEPYLGSTPTGGGNSLYGLSFAHTKNSAVFLETIRDANYDAHQFRADNLLKIENIAVHEFTHVGGMGIDHPDNIFCLMAADPDKINEAEKFCDETIGKLRKIGIW